MGQLDFEWDDGNLGHLKRATPEECEEVFFNRPLRRRGKRIGEEHRQFALGKTDAGRWLEVVYVAQSGGMVRVVTAIDMKASEVAYYRRRMMRCEENNCPYSSRMKSSASLLQSRT